MTGGRGWRADSLRMGSRRPSSDVGGLLVGALVGYIAGLVPSASLAARAASGGEVDLRTAGSGNPGGANAAAAGPWRHEQLIDEGATEIVSVHTGSDISASFDAARLASAQVDVRVELVDTGAASFVVGLAALAAAECLAAGRSAVEAVAAAARVATTSGNVFVVGALDLARTGGRLAGGTADAATTGSVPVLRLLHGEMSVIGQAEGVEDAAAKMAAEILAAGDRLRSGCQLRTRGPDPSSTSCAGSSPRHPQSWRCSSTASGRASARTPDPAPPARCSTRSDGRRRSPAGTNRFHELVHRRASAGRSPARALQAR